MIHDQKNLMLIFGSVPEHKANLIIILIAFKNVYVLCACDNNLYCTNVTQDKALKCVQNIASFTSRSLLQAINRLLKRQINILKYPKLIFKLHIR